jgi:hypothetical protein
VAQSFTKNISTNDKRLQLIKERWNDESSENEKKKASCPIIFGQKK